MHSDFIASEADSDKLHAMRIAGKRLRYTMEIFAPLYGGDLEPFILAMKEIQDTLANFMTQTCGSLGCQSSWIRKRHVLKITLVIPARSKG